MSLIFTSLKVWLSDKSWVKYFSNSISLLRHLCYYTRDTADDIYLSTFFRLRFLSTPIPFIQKMYNNLFRHPAHYLLFHRWIDFSDKYTFWHLTMCFITSCTPYIHPSCVLAQSSSSSLKTQIKVSSHTQKWKKTSNINRRRKIVHGFLLRYSSCIFAMYIVCILY